MFQQLRTLSRVARALVSTPFLLTAGCSSPDADSAWITSQGIAYGQLSGPEDDGVLMLDSIAANGGRFYCTGTLVAPNLLLTARHCVSTFNGNAFVCNQDGSLVPTPEMGGVLGPFDDPGNVRVYANDADRPGSPLAVGTDIRGRETSSICSNDIVFVLLDRELDRPVVPIRMLTAVKRMEKLRAVGFGYDENNAMGIRHTRSDIPVTAVGPSDYVTDPSAIEPRTFRVTQGACQVDSGGPILTEQNAVAGVFSRITGGCTASGVDRIYVHVSGYKSLIDEAFALSGYEPLLEQLPGAGGAGGSSGIAGAPAEDAGEETGGTEAGGAAPIDYHGVRKKGGCTCNVVGGGTNAWALAALVPLLTLFLRRRRAA